MTVIGAELPVFQASRSGKYCPNAVIEGAGPTVRADRLKRGFVGRPR